MPKGNLTYVGKHIVIKKAPPVKAVPLKFNALQALLWVIVTQNKLLKKGKPNA